MKIAAAIVVATALLLLFRPGFLKKNLRFLSDSALRKPQYFDPTASEKTFDGLLAAPKTYQQLYPGITYQPLYPSIVPSNK